MNTCTSSLETCSQYLTPDDEDHHSAPACMYSVCEGYNCIITYHADIELSMSLKAILIKLDGPVLS